MHPLSPYTLLCVCIYIYVVRAIRYSESEVLKQDVDFDVLIESASTSAPFVSTTEYIPKPMSLVSVLNAHDRRYVLLVTDSSSKCPRCKLIAGACINSRTLAFSQEPFTVMSVGRNIIRNPCFAVGLDSWQVTLCLNCPFTLSNSKANGF